MKDFDELEESFKSKSDIKKEMHALQDLGVELLDVPVNVYKKFPIPEELDEAIQVYRKITSNNAKKRQRGYIGRIMRSLDPAPIENALQEWKDGNKKLAREFHRLEQVREELLEGSQQAINDVMELYPDCDRQQLMQLIRSAQKEAKENSPPKSFKKLFQFLKALAQQSA